MPKHTYKRVFKAARKKLEAAPTEVRNELAIYVIERLVPRTPVDTGRARGNWRMDLGATAQQAARAKSLPALSGEEAAELLTDPASLDPTGTRRPKEIGREIKAAPPGRTIVLSNWLPYISFLEHGSSQQAPNGFLALTAAEAAVFAKALIRKAL